MAWKGKIVSIIIAVIVAAVVVYMLYQVLTWKLFFGPTKPYRELTSMAALACAIDVVATNDPTVETCDKSFNWPGGVSNIFEALAGMSTTATMKITSLASDKGVEFTGDFDVACKPTGATGATSSYVCMSRVGDVSSVKCYKEDQQWKCEVYDFILNQKIPPVESLQAASEILSNYGLGGIAGDFLQQFGAAFTTLIGSPQYVIFYETFPVGAEDYWRYTTLDTVMIGAAIGGALNVGLEGFSVGKSLLKKGGKSLVIVNRESREVAFKAAESKIIQSMFGEEIAKKGIKQAVKSLVRGAVVRDVLCGRANLLLEKRVVEKLAEIFQDPEIKLKECRKMIGELTKELGIGDKRFGGKLFDDVLSYVRLKKLKGELEGLSEEEIGERIEDAFRNFLRDKGAKSEEIEIFLQQEETEKVIERLSKAASDERMKKPLKDLLPPEELEDLISTLESEISKKAIKVTKEARKIYGTEGYLMGVGAMSEKAEARLWKRVAEYVNDGMKEMKRLIERVELETGEKGLAEKIGDEIERVASEGVEAQEAVKLWEKLVVMGKGGMGLPPAWKGKKRILPLASGVAAAGYLLAVQEMKSELFTTCGANSLCLYIPSIFFPSPITYNITLKKPSTTFVITEIKTIVGNVVGHEQWRGWAVSPCEATVVVEKSTMSCDGKFVSENEIAYKAFKRKCRCKVIEEHGVIYREDKSCGYECCEKGTCERHGETWEFCKFTLEKITVGNEDVFTVSREYCENKFKRTGEFGEYVDYVSCVREDFLKRVENNPSVDLTLNETEGCKYELQFKLLNVKRTRDGEYVPITQCKDAPSNWFQSIDMFLSGSSQSVEAVKISFTEPKTSTLTPNYCVPRKTKTGNVAALACEAFATAAGIAFTIGTGGVGSLAALYVIGATGEICGSWGEIQNKWPSDQFS